MLVTLRDKAEQVRKVERFVRSGVPVVDLTIERPHLRLPRVVSDHEGNGRVAARHFIERGFTNFAWFSSGWTHVHELRMKGFKAELPKRLLADPSISIRQIAAVCGFCNPAYFTNVFRKMTGQTPKAWRSQNQKKRTVVHTR